MEKQNIYLTNTDMEFVLENYLSKLSQDIVKTVEADIRKAAGMITAKPVFARLSSPNHNAAAMDGIAVTAKKTYGAKENNPVLLKKDTDFIYVNTGNVIPEPFDAVIMIEDVYNADENCAEIISPCSPWQHIRPIGEDIVAGEMIVPENHCIRPVDIGAILAGGIQNITVYEPVRVGIIPTGSEITDDYETLEPGKIFDTNSWVFDSMVKSYGCISNRISPIKDDFDLLKNTAAQSVAENHVVLVIAGSSAGTKDFTSSVIAELGEVFVHGISIKPGKPTILGMINNKPVIGLPGYPGSAYLVFEEIVKPIIYKLARKTSQPQNSLSATLSKRVVSSLKHKEYIRVSLSKVGDKTVAAPLNRGAGVTMSLVRSDGLLIVPKNSEGFEAGEQVLVHNVDNPDKTGKTMVSIGSHDLILDIISSIMGKNFGYFLASAHTGSLAGLLALKRGETHIAPIHLLDTETGIYNLSYISKYLPEKEIILIKGVRRIQGIITKKGNPLNIKSINDLTRENIRFVNRQKGSGTRILTDYQLSKNNIDQSLINGYHREMTTHMAVAAAVAGNSADCGMGIYSAAKALDLDFIPIGSEDYDFAIPKEFIESEMIKCFIETLRSEEFKNHLKNTGGYEFPEIGNIAENK